MQRHDRFQVREACRRDEPVEDELIENLAPRPDTDDARLDLPSRHGLGKVARHLVSHGMR